MNIRNISDIPCMILCGGKGTRLRDVTESLPKPMVPIGEVPIVVHIMKQYAKFGVKRFILCLGYKKEVFIDYFINYQNNSNNITIDYKNGKIINHGNNSLDWEVTLVDTGLESKTGLRVFKASKFLKEEDKSFFLTYGDGVSDIDIKELFNSHISKNKLITVSAVKNPSRFGLIDFDNNGLIKSFEEKNTSDGYINGGFMVIQQEFIYKYLDDSDVFFEQEPLSKAMEDKMVNAYKHDGFWQCMDNSKEYKLLNDLWTRGEAKWIIQK